MMADGSFQESCGRGNGVAHLNAGRQQTWGDWCREGQGRGCAWRNVGFSQCYLTDIEKEQSATSKFSSTDLTKVCYKYAPSCWGGRGETGFPQQNEGVKSFERHVNYDIDMFCPFLSIVNGYFKHLETEAVETLDSFGNLIVDGDSTWDKWHKCWCAFRKHQEPIRASGNINP